LCIHWPEKEKAMFIYIFVIFILANLTKAQTSKIRCLFSKLSLMEKPMKSYTFVTDKGRKKIFSAALFGKYCNPETLDRIAKKDCTF
jgi:hypothetical protein